MNKRNGIVSTKTNRIKNHFFISIFRIIATPIFLYISPKTYTVYYKTKICSIIKKKYIFDAYKNVYLLSSN